MIMVEEDRVQSLKVIELRDKILESNKDSKDPDFIRLRIEKKLRDDFQKTKEYGKYLKSGRVDKIDTRRRHKLVTPIKDLQDAYYEKYKPRKDRDTEESENQQQNVKQEKKSKHNKPTTESFYDDDDEHDDDDYSINDDQSQTKSSQSPSIPYLKQVYGGILPPTSSGSNASSIPGFQASPSPTLQNLLAQTTGGSQSPNQGTISSPWGGQMNQIPPPPTTQPPAIPSAPTPSQAPTPMPPWGFAFPPPIPGAMPFNPNMFANPTQWFNTFSKQQNNQQQQGFPNPWGFPNVGFDFNQVYQQNQAQQLQPNNSTAINYGDDGSVTNNQNNSRNQQSSQQNRTLQPY
ncbi:Calpain-B [Wickerhamomyces ciferrii]|uniref:Calpain-B n=1 Tax=Wickerhamomyces ciferrii (strain ATCC 14091 / BCRC 22168 / CBS 111 / JCM 3599 / NBRC 0793 / NRRL Y-1031 F-60-10) TaxID=1206466 RepID=K0KFH4_WICCF|nr:Calpain-B [Wickerhamomyces ciferrii]CCH41686.1 Calpain-B [Wickerhamomyces ciferrii]